jgi:asparagine synthase (glutamine-hydrolysing)
MCGIGGIVTRRAGLAPPEVDALRRMAGAMRHRGPDESGLYRSAQAGLCHTRLSIIDLETGQQPLANEDESLWVVFNGEIYNYLELREDLLALGHRFRTKSDTEVIVHAWEAWGERAFSRFNGQWSIALWNERSEMLVLARDRVGVRPLHVAEHEGRIYFASEVKAIFAAEPGILRALDPAGLEEVFTFWSCVAPQTPFAGVREVPPGHVRIYAKGAVAERAYYKPRYPLEDGEGEHKASLEEATDLVRDALRSATRLRALRADVPVGSYLSGGLDSSLVAAMAQEARGTRLTTFSLRFADAEYDETPYQREMVAALGSEHHELVVTHADIARVLPEVVLHAERPLLRTAPAPLYLLSGLVRDAGIKVVLTGEGADEMFAGYDIFREGKIRRHWAKHPGSKQRPLLLAKLYPYLSRSPVTQRAMTQKFFGQALDRAVLPGFAHETRWRTTGALKRLFSADMARATAGLDVIGRLFATLPPELPRWPALAQDQYLEVRTLLSGYLLSSQGDRMLMAHSVEGRFPFLDADVMALANSLPPAYKLKVLDEKHVLKRAAQGLVPEAILRRTKQPYRAPDALCFAGDAAPGWAREAMSERAVREAGVFDPRAVAMLWSKCRGRAGEVQFSNADNMALIGVLTTQLLHQRLVRAAPRAGMVNPRTFVDRVR